MKYNVSLVKYNESYSSHLTGTIYSPHIEYIEPVLIKSCVVKDIQISMTLKTDA